MPGLRYSAGRRAGCMGRKVKREMWCNPADGCTPPRSVRGALSRHHKRQHGPAPSHTHTHLPTLGISTADSRLLGSHLRGANHTLPPPTRSPTPHPRLTDGSLVREFALPGIGSIGGFSGTRKGTEFFYSFQSAGGRGPLQHRCQWPWWRPWGAAGEGASRSSTASGVCGAAGRAGVGGGGACSWTAAVTNRFGGATSRKLAPVWHHFAAADRLRGAGRDVPR